MAISSVSAPIDVKPALTTEQIKRLDELEKDEKSKALKEKQTMGQEQFLFLITEQLKNQDPLSPMKDEQFIAQMAQLQALESTNSLVKLTQSNTDTLKEIKTSMDMLNTSMKELIKKASEPAPTTPGTTTAAEDSKAILDELIKLNKAFTAYTNK